MDAGAGDESSAGKRRLDHVSKGFERTIITILAAMLMIVIALSTLELAWKIVVDITTPPVVLLGVEELLDLFGFFLLVLIGVELLETVKAFLRGDARHIEVVLEVALIALARKVVALDLSKYSGGVIAGIALLVLGLAVAIAVVRRDRVTQA